MSEEKSIDEIKQLLKNKKLLRHKNSQLSSEVWNSFEFLNYKDNENYSGFVICLKCKNPLKHDKKKSGTTHLRNHIIKYCKQNKLQSQSTKITGFFKSTSSLPSSSKTKLMDGLVAFVANDLRPFKAVEDVGFLKLANTLLEIGAKHGMLGAEEILPSRFSVKREVIKRANAEKRNFGPRIKEAVTKWGMIGLTTDMWSNLKNQHFMSLTVHFFEDMCLKLAITHVTLFEEKKTGGNICHKIEFCCQELGLTTDDILNHCYFVTDNASNLKLALAAYKRIPCSCHVLATVVGNVLQPSRSATAALPLDASDYDIVDKIEDCLAQCKSVTAFCKRSGMNNQLKKSLKQSCETRWNSILYMLESILDAKNELIEKLDRRGEASRLSGVDIGLVKSLIDFLTPFEKMTKVLEGDGAPTLHKVYQCFCVIERSMKFSPLDSAIVHYLKKQGTLCLQKKFLINDIHLLALFFNPKFKSLTPLTSAEKKKVHCHAQQLIENCISNVSNDDLCEISAVAEHRYANQATSSSCSLDDQFEDWLEESNDDEENEVSKYIRSSFENELALGNFSDDRGFNLVRFWSSALIIKIFPKLSRLALGILCIPASSASSERAFSTCSNTATKKRSCLTSSSLESLVVLNSLQSKKCKMS